MQEEEERQSETSTTARGAACEMSKVVWAGGGGICSRDVLQGASKQSISLFIPVSDILFSDCTKVTTTIQSKAVQSVLLQSPPSSAKLL